MNQRALLLLGLGLVGLAVLGSVLVLRAGSPAPPPDPASRPASSGDRLASQLPAGEVAVAVYLDALAGAGDAVRAGDRIDVLAFFSPQLAGGRAMTRALLTNTPVLRVARQADGQTMTLAVTPDQALLLQQATQLGARPFAVLRASQGETASASQEMLTDQDLIAWLTRPAGETPSRAAR